MIVIDRRDDPLFIIRMEGVVTSQDLSEYRHLCEDLALREGAYATIWVDEGAPCCLHTQREQPLMPEQASQTRPSPRLSIWALLRMLSA